MQMFFQKKKKSRCYLSCKHHPEILLTSLKASIHFCFFSTVTLSSVSCLAKTVSNGPFWLCTSEGSTWSKTGKIDNPVFSLHSTILASSSKHRFESANFSERTTIAYWDSSIAFMSSKATTSPTRSFSLSLKTWILFRLNSSYKWSEKPWRVSSLLKLRKTSYFLPCVEEEYDDDDEEEILSKIREAIGNLLLSLFCGKVKELQNGIKWVLC